MTNKKQLLFVINPVAGNGNTRLIEKAIHENLDHSKCDFEMIYTKHARHASELSKSGIAHQKDIIVAVGGDGSVNEVAKTLVGTSHILAIIPSGSGNGLARHLKIPLQPAEAVKRINQGVIRQIDTAKINDEFFMNVAGIGFDAVVSKKFAEFGKRGFISYARLSVSTFRNYKAGEYKLTIDGKQLNSRSFLIAIANSSQYGNDAFIAPEAKVSDGELDVCLVKPFSFPSLPKFIYHLFRKSLHTTKFVEYHRGKEIIIHQEGKLAHYDGECFEPGQTLNIRIQPNSINVLT